MQLDTTDCVWEAFDSWQGEMAEASMSRKNIVLVNRWLTVGIGFRDCRGWSGAQRVIY
jgi:hypothetical protein